MNKRLTLFQALLWIFCSTLLINSFAYGCIKGYFFWKKKVLLTRNIPIKTIVQTGPQKEALKTAYLAEILNLSKGKYVLSSEFDVKQAQERLLSSPVIQEADIKVKQPGVLQIDYTTRHPIAILLDFENVALDEKGVPFPLMPFFTPKKLPEIYLDLEEDIQWNRPISGEKLEIAFELLKLIQNPSGELFNLKRIDVSHLFEKSYGRQEIVVLAEDILELRKGEKQCHCFLPRYLRLSPKNYSQELSDYLKLREQLLSKESTELELPEDGQIEIHCPPKVIDLRIPQLAFIDEPTK